MVKFAFGSGVIMDYEFSINYDKGGVEKLLIRSNWFFFSSFRQLYYDRYIVYRLSCYGFSSNRHYFIDGPRNVCKNVFSNHYLKKLLGSTWLIFSFLLYLSAFLFPFHLSFVSPVKKYTHKIGFSLLLLHIFRSIVRSVFDPLSFWSLSIP